MDMDETAFSLFLKIRSNMLTRFLTQKSGTVNPSFPAKLFEGKPSVEVEFFICRSRRKERITSSCM